MKARSAADMQTGNLPIPDHVPRELVRNDLTYIRGREPNDNDDPFYRSRELLSQDVPPIFYTTERGSRLYRTPGIWMLTRHEDISRIYQDITTFSTEGRIGIQALVGAAWSMIPLEIDPPDHTKYRMLLNPKFSAVAMDKMQHTVHDTANGLIDRFIDAGECDFTVDFARPYPIRIFLTLMGLPFSDYLSFYDWASKILHSDDNSVRTEGLRSALDYLRRFVAERKRRPEDDLASYIIHGQIDGRALTEDEIIGTIIFIFIAGLDTVAATLCLMWRKLALHPQMQRQLADNPGLLPGAVEEFLRINPLGNASRVVTRDTVIRGVLIKKGDVVQALDIAGNFDPDAFQNPQIVDFARRPNPHFSLGGGPHLCLGAPLARRELRIALGEWMKRIPGFRVKPGAAIPAYPGLISVPSLPLVWSLGNNA
jgi:cytochrome P450